MTPEEFKQKAVIVAERSKAIKRKVGAVVTTEDGKHYATGHNYNSNNVSGDCEDIDGNTLPGVIHAEIAAIDYWRRTLLPNKLTTIYCTHQPCDNCLKAIHKEGITNIVIVENFLKFDTHKLRYDLVPPSSIRALAEVLTYGAKKYKPNNWKLGDKDRYIAAMFRHIEDWRAGERNDPESGMHHLAHALTNCAFLLFLDTEDDKK